tara:strand:+ start:880 stop:1215 length:336 start_codon:yes stop_codon:yes gene_type:complete
MSKQTDPRSTKKRSKQRDSTRGTCKTKKKKEAKHRRQNFISKKHRDLYAQQHGIFLQKQRIAAAFQSSPIEVRKRKERSKKQREACKLKNKITKKRKKKRKKAVKNGSLSI